MTLEELNRIVSSRAEADPDESWTAKLLAKGPAKCAEKFGEEAIEAIIEAARGDRQKLANETADLLFHLLVMLKACDVPLSDVMAVLDSRTGRSGITEKAERSRES
ncbi:phosphoribosyl-ATP diphosphatase [Mesobacterium sp. TK19101]|uniref:Phosphoribosyl-ATP pyrophosphatase n=1 Tax=Mesobacterium hydrothermale TaxID=3111907 RepID=A0ABU6HDP3_9RHOB|nr:phosphoribosyl-ATP diphosphatase [Mesobacterium sp. TK19101]MEC3859990.1 phosphoribosyl-ATP diphosphatase [Mesobacterium sp. TK19101]